MSSSPPSASLGKALKVRMYGGGGGGDRLDIVIYARFWWGARELAEFWMEDIGVLLLKELKLR